MDKAVRSENFALIGVGGYVAARHLEAIQATGNQLIAAIDPHDAVGVVDRYFPDAKFFVEIERFDRFLEKLRRQASPQQISYVSVCSPNFLHDAHIRLGLRVRAHVICEKPLVLSPWNLDALTELQDEYQRKVYTVLQLRLLPALAELRKRLQQNPSRKKHDVVLSYITRRGPWYQVSWKGDELKSGGIAMNIGIHFFDLLLWLFGTCAHYEVHLNESNKMAGFLELERANVRWFLSTDKNDLPAGYLETGKPAFRSLRMDGEELEFSTGFTNLHTEVYRDVLQGGGFGLEEARSSIELVHRLRQAKISDQSAARHPNLVA